MKDNAVKWLYSIPGRKKLYIAILTLTQGLYGTTGVLYALFLRNIVDAATGHDKLMFWGGITLIIGLVMVQLLLRAVIRWLTELSKSVFENIFKHRLTDTLLHRDLLRVSAIHSGEWMNRLTNDTVVVANGYVEIIPGLAEMVVKLVSAIVMIIILEPRFALILLPGSFVLVFFTWLFRRALKHLHKAVQEADGRVRIFLQERISSMLMIRSFAAEGQVLSQADGKMTEHKNARMRKNRFSNLCNIGFGAAMNGMYLLGVGWCGYGILTGTVSFGTLTAITQLISQIQAPFANITGYLPRYYAMLASAERLMEAEGFKQDEESALGQDGIDALGWDAIGLKNVDFSYPQYTDGENDLCSGEMPATLRHITFQIRKGETVAFTGSSGCGKSTVLKLLMCVYTPDSGERYFAGGNGDRYPLTPAHRRLFAYVPQGNVLMNGTVREVVSMARPSLAQEDDILNEALRVACAEDFVSELEQGVDTLLGERGMGLSEGQMQRIAIARAIFSGSPVLLLDEATSALDEETEKKLLSNLQGLKDKTVIIVTHRPAVLCICDRVMRFTEVGIEEKRKFTDTDGIEAKGTDGR